MNSSEIETQKKLLSQVEIDNALATLSQGWSSPEYRHLYKAFTFSNFKKALAFTNEIGQLAEKQRHHPDIFLTWGKVTTTIWTHDAGGITTLDINLAKAIDLL